MTSKAASSQAQSKPAAAPPITLRVMRMYAVPPHMEVPFTYVGASDSGFGLTNLIVVPSAMGHVYQGQSLDCFMCVWNYSGKTIRQVSLSARISAPSGITKLRDDRKGHAGYVPGRSVIGGTHGDIQWDQEPEKPRTLRHGEGNDLLIRHVHPRAEQFSLNVTHSYLSPETHKVQSFPKNYNVKVKKPFKCLFNSSVIDTQKNNVVFVEASVLNQTHYTVILSQVSFLTAASHLTAKKGQPPLIDFSVEILNDDTQQPSKASSLSVAVEDTNKKALRKDVARKFVFKLTPTQKVKGPLFHAASTYLGNLHITWRSPMGETADFRSANVRFAHVQPAAVYVTAAIDGDAKTNIGCPVLVTVTVRNASAVPKSLFLSLQGSPAAVTPVGTTRCALGVLPPKEVKEVQVTFLPLAEGLHTLTGIRVADGEGTYHCEECPQLLVLAAS